MISFYPPIEIIFLAARRVVVRRRGLPRPWCDDYRFIVFILLHRRAGGRLKLRVGGLRRRENACFWAAMACCVGGRRRDGARWAWRWKPKISRDAVMRYEARPARGGAQYRFVAPPTM